MSRTVLRVAFREDPHSSSDGGPQLSHYIFSFNQIKFVHINLKFLTSN
jgi:hypothetical protein